MFYNTDLLTQQNKAQTKSTHSTLQRDGQTTLIIKVVLADLNERKGFMENLASWSDEEIHANLDPSLRFSEQTIDSLGSPELWKAVCPWMCCNDDKEGGDESISGASKNIDHTGLAEQLRNRGYFALSEREMELSEDSITVRMAMAIMRLVAYGYPPTMVMVYDEAWILGKRMGTMCETACGPHIGDWYVFLVDPANHSYKPGPPHRDRPAAGASSFHQDDAPKYCSVWLALTEATPQNSCLYFVPKEDDPGYHGDGDAIPSGLHWGNIVAQPLKPGGMLAFSHRVLHWGSKPQPNYQGRPRIALTCAFADSSFEEQYFDHAKCLPFPPLGLRIGLVAGQQIQYEHLAKLDKYSMALYRRIFVSINTTSQKNTQKRSRAQCSFWPFSCNETTQSRRAPHPCVKLR